MTNPIAHDQLQQALSEQQTLLAQTVRAENRLLRETLNLYDNYVDPLDALHVNGQRWDPLTPGRADTQQGFRSEQELAAARAQCRALALENEFAINGHENRISYIVGDGHQYAAAAKKHASPPEGLVAACQAEIDAFIQDNGWHRRQQEIVRRRDRDGEAFLRFFLDSEGKTKIRFVEPWQVTTPQHDPAAAFGIRTDPDDVETVLGYWLDDGELVDAADMQHRKANVDANVRRGVPTFYPVRKNLARAEKLLRNMAAVSDIQTAIALIRKHRTAGKGTVEQLRSGLAAATVTSRATGRTTHFQPFQPGTILDVPGDADYDFPAAGLDAGRYVRVLQAILRAVASRLVMPEFMLSSDLNATSLNPSASTRLRPIRCGSSSQSCAL